MLVADVPPPEGSNIRFRWVEIMFWSWTRGSDCLQLNNASGWWCTPWWPSAGCSSSWKGGDRHSILVADQHDHLHHQLQWSPSYQLLVTISMASKIPWRWKKSKRLGKKFEGRAASLEVMIAVTLTFIVSKRNGIFLSIDFYGHQNLQAESIVKERQTEEKSSPVPNLFQLRPKW